eukprot:TRINITY_DN3393_c0_g2_i1.p1 TRINITY_DN3393_c0_g2~~TRINITY_DN3393_c0_g2_i1.p1  ORF type:complete len:435 (+),score=88.78 TRINITY_DN3393_c0_g2_i1:55-1305(+)
MLDNVIAVLPGAMETDRLVIIGASRDSFVYGAVNGGTATAVLLEVARAFADLAEETGWRPRRTLVFASWDGGVYGHHGSTEWAEDHDTLLESQAVAYMNIDVGVSGKDMLMSGSPALTNLMRSVASKVKDPTTGKSLLSAWAANEQPYPSVKDPLSDASVASSDDLLPVFPLDASSDPDVFLSHLGVSSANVATSDRGLPYGTYHSKYDTVNYLENQIDPDYAYQKMLAQVMSLVAYSLATDEILPLSYVDYAHALAHYVSLVETACAAACPTGVLPAGLESTFTTLNASVVRLRSACDIVEGDIAEHHFNTGSRNASVLYARGINDRLMMAERAFILDAGVSARRPWYRHAAVAPPLFGPFVEEEGTYNDIGSVFPGLMEAIVVSDEVELLTQLTLVSQRIESVARSLEGALYMT